ncbi:electron transfer flavoprotein subunit alpha/FixB family protein [Chloroflexota bacterium]
MSPDKSVWVFIELKEGKIRDVSLELLSQGRKIADKAGERVYAVAIGSEIQEQQTGKLAHYGADRIYLAENQLDYSAELYSEILVSFIREQKPGIVLFGATSTGKDLALRVAAKLKTGLGSDCTSLDLTEEGLLLQTKPVYGSRLSAEFVLRGTSPQIVTVRPGVMEMEKPDTSLKAEIMPVAPQVGSIEPRSRVIDFIKADPKTISLSEADIIVAGGGGAGDRENFRLIEELAEVLGGTVGASRVPVDEDWVPFDKQIGQTGKTVEPSLYIACGISGAIYHTMGMKDSKAIVAINKDRSAPIFKLADMGIVGDLVQIVPAIITLLREKLARA